MTAPIYADSGAGAADNGTSGTISPAAPATVSAGNLLIWHGFVDSDPIGGSLSTPTGFTAFPGNPYGTRTTNVYTPRVYLFWKLAAGTEGGAALGSNYTLAGAVNSRGVYAQVHRFTSANGFAAAPVEAIAITEGITETGATTLACPTITPTTVNRLGVICCSVNNNAGTVASATGESGGDWVEAVAEFVSGVGGDGTIGLQVADLTGGGAISGGTIPYGAVGDEWVNVGFALASSANLFLTPQTGLGAASGAAPARVSTLVAQGGVALASGAAPALSHTLSATPGVALTSGNAPEVTLDIPTAINTVEIGAVAWLLQGITALVPGAGEGLALGNTPPLSLTLILQPGLATATGNTPTLTLTVPAILTPETGQALAGGNTPTIQHTTRINPDTGDASAVGEGPSIDYGLSGVMGEGLALGDTPPVSLSITPTSGIAIATGSSPTLTLINLAILTPTAGEALASGNAPTIQHTTQITPDAGETSAAGGGPNIGVELPAGAGAGFALGNAPPLFLTLAPQYGTATASGNAPALALAAQITPDTGSATAQGWLPDHSYQLAATSGSALATGAAPNVIVGANTVEIGSVAWLFAGPKVIDPERGLGAAIGNNPTLSLAHTAAQGEISAIGEPPTLSDTHLAQAGTALASGIAPDISVFTVSITPQTGLGVAQGDIPGPIVIYSITDPGLTGTIWAIGNAPLVTINNDVVIWVLPGLEAASGDAPTLQLGLAAAQTGSGSVAGEAPGVSLSFGPGAGLASAIGVAPALAYGLLPEASGTVATGGNAPTLDCAIAAQSGIAIAQGTQPEVSLQIAGAPATGTGVAVGSVPPLTSTLSGAIAGEVAASGNAPDLLSQTALTPETGVGLSTGAESKLSLAIAPTQGSWDGVGAIPARTSTLAPVPGSVNATGNSPIVAIQTASSPSTGIGIAVGNSPTLQNVFLLAPAYGDVLAVGAASTLSRQLSLSAGAAFALGNESLVWLQAENSPLTGLAAASGNAPLLSLVLAPARGITLASGTPPHVSTGLDLTPQTSVVQASGNQPLRQLAFGPASSTVPITGNTLTLAQILTATEGFIQVGGPAPALTQALAAAAGTITAAGEQPERFVGRFVFPEPGFALASAVEASTRTLILELVGTTVLRVVGSVGEVQLALPGNRRETVLTRLYARLLLLTPSGVFVTRNSTIPLAIPPAGAVVMLDSGPDTTDRGMLEDFYEHRVRLELFLLENNPLAKTIQDLEDEVAATLAGDRTLGGVIDQMFLFPASSLALTGEGTPIDIHALSISLAYGEPHAAL